MSALEALAEKFDQLREVADKIGINPNSLRIVAGEPIIEIQVSTLTQLLVSCRELDAQVTEFQSRGTAQLIAVRALALETAAKICENLYAMYPNELDGTYDAAIAIRKLIEDPSIGAISMLLTCPDCSTQHIDEGEWTTRLHRTHQCQGCLKEWRPANVPTVGVKSL